MQAPHVHREIGQEKEEHAVRKNWKDDLVLKNKSNISCEEKFMQQRE